MGQGDTMNFRNLIKPTPRKSVFKMDGWYVWCGSSVKGKDGLYYLLFSRWPEGKGFDAWVTNSEIAYAVAFEPLGPYEYRGIALKGSGSGWDADVTHNPTVIKNDNKYYMYYMGTRGPGSWWDYRNNQRIGVAVAAHPAGPWERFDKPVLDVSSGEWDCLMTSNPSCTRGPDGKFYMMYKGVGAGPMPKGGKVLAGMAVADDPLGPFTKKKGPVIENPESGWSVEDAFVWYQNDRFYALIKDFQGFFTKSGRDTLAMFESKDGLNWKMAENPLAHDRNIQWEDGKTQKMLRLERPQILLENGSPIALFCACMPDIGSGTYNVHIPLHL